MSHNAMFKALSPYSTRLTYCVPRLFSTSSQFLRRSPHKPSKMSWMDSWSRPSKSQATPVPFYLLPGGESTPYCHSCGRVISSRRTAANTKTKYCSSRCRTVKLGKLDRELERAFVYFLAGGHGESTDEAGNEKGHSGKQKKAKHTKGDQRILVSCSTVEEYVFGPRQSSQEALRSEPDDEGSHDLDFQQTDPGDPTSFPEDIDLDGNITQKDHIDGDVLARMSVRSGTRIRPPQSVSEVNGSVGGEKGRAERIQETDEMLEKRREGQKRAKGREMTKCAARRGVVFGFAVDEVEDSSKAGEGERRLCEAVMAGKVVEPSFAKGDWAIRWRK